MGFMTDALQKKRILVVDDELAMLDIVKSVLKRAEAIPEGANSIDRGMQLVKTQSFDAVVLDRYLGEEDGHVLLKAIKDDPQTAQLPVIMLTGEKDMKEVKASVTLGAAG